MKYDWSYTGLTVAQMKELDAYQSGVDRMLEYIESIHAYPKLIAELRWAIDEGII